MAQNRQLQKDVDPHAVRIRHRRRLFTTNPRFAARHPGLANFLTREATRANATPLRIATLAVNVGGTGYAVGDKFLVVGGTFSDQASGIVTEVAAGVVTAIAVLDAGTYTINPGVAAVTADFQAKNGTTPGTGLTIDTTLSGVVAGVTDAELLAGLRAQLDVGGTVPTITRARHFRNRRQTDATYTQNGVPVV